jgi:predicted dehydrogenase
VAEVVEAIATGKPAWATVEDGHEIMKIVEACSSSSRERRWVGVTASGSAKKGDRA